MVVFLSLKIKWEAWDLLEEWCQMHHCHPFFGVAFFWRKWWFTHGKMMEKWWRKWWFTGFFMEIMMIYTWNSDKLVRFLPVKAHKGPMGHQLQPKITTPSLAQGLQFVMKSVANLKIRLETSDPIFWYILGSWWFIRVGNCPILGILDITL